MTPEVAKSLVRFLDCMSAAIEKEYGFIVPAEKAGDTSLVALTKEAAAKLVEEIPDKEPVAKKAPKKEAKPVETKPVEVKPTAVVTIEEVTEECVKTAKALGPDGRNKVQKVLKDVGGAPALKDIAADKYPILLETLKGLSETIGDMNDF